MAGSWRNAMSKLEELKRRKRELEAKTKGGQYASHRDEMARRHRAESAAGRDIAPGFRALPPGDLGRREPARNNLRLFFETYFPACFTIPWSKDHPRVIDRLQEAVLGGGLYALAMPRGSGKTGM